jgi:hypothetical protein
MSTVEVERVGVRRTYRFIKLFEYLCFLGVVNKVIQRLWQGGFYQKWNSETKLSKRKIGRKTAEEESRKWRSKSSNHSGILTQQKEQDSLKTKSIYGWVIFSCAVFVGGFGVFGAELIVYYMSRAIKIRQHRKFLTCVMTAKSSKNKISLNDLRYFP